MNSHHWISINDKQPEIDERVIVWIAKDYSSDPQMQFAEFAGSGNRFLNGLVMMIDAVEKWMPSPAKPEDVNE
jgi:hypothetical protein